jgi:hypothetical protein
VNDEKATVRKAAIQVCFSLSLFLSFSLSLSVCVSVSKEKISLWFVNLSIFYVLRPWKRLHVVKSQMQLLYRAI